MKAFRYVHADGSTTIDCETLTVGELKSMLEKYPSEMPILATWEGIYASIREKRDGDNSDYITVEKPKHDRWHPEDKVECLILDVNER